MQPSELGKLLSLSGQTVRRWASEYERFLSPGANPRRGDTRRFDTHDQRVMLLVAELRQAGLDSDAILERLESERSQDYAGLPTLPPGWGDNDTITTELAAARAHEITRTAVLQTQLEYTQQALQQAQERAEALERDLQDAHDDQTATEAARQALALELANVRGEVEALKARLDSYRLAYGFGRDQPVSVAVIIVGALVAGAVLVMIAFVLARLLL